MVKRIEQLLSENAQLRARLRQVEQRRLTEVLQGPAECTRACQAAVRSAAWRELVNMIVWQPARHQAEQARQRLEFDQQVRTETDKRGSHD